MQRKHNKNFSANWDGSFIVLEDIDKGAYKLERLSSELVPNTWNVSYLKIYFS